MPEVLPSSSSCSKWVRLQEKFETSARPTVCSFSIAFFLIERNHEVFRGKGIAEQPRQKRRKAVEAEYPDHGTHLPTERRQGFIPDSVLETLHSFVSTASEEDR